MDNGEILSKFYVCFDVVMAMRAFEVHAHLFHNYYLLLLGAGDRCPISSRIDINKLIIELQYILDGCNTLVSKLSAHVPATLSSGVRIGFGDSGNVPHVCDDDTSIRNCIMMNPHKCDPTLKIPSSIFPFATVA